MLNVYIKDVNGNVIDGWVQLNKEIKETKDGKTTFHVSDGEYILRCIVLAGCRGQTEKINVKGDTDVFLIAKRC